MYITAFYQYEKYVMLMIHTSLHCLYIQFYVVFSFFYSSLKEFLYISHEIVWVSDYWMMCVCVCVLVYDLFNAAYYLIIMLLEANLYYIIYLPTYDSARLFVCLYLCTSSILYITYLLINSTCAFINEMSNQIVV